MAAICLPEHYSSSLYGIYMCGDVAVFLQKICTPLYTYYTRESYREGMCHPVLSAYMESCRQEMGECRLVNMLLLLNLLDFLDIHKNRWNQQTNAVIFHKISFRKIFGQVCFISLLVFWLLSSPSGLNRCMAGLTFYLIDLQFSALLCWVVLCWLVIMGRWRTYELD